jgi:large subunit ribosomal protein L21
MLQSTAWTRRWIATANATANATTSSRIFSTSSSTTSLPSLFTTTTHNKNLIQNSRGVSTSSSSSCSSSLLSSSSLTSFLNSTTSLHSISSTHTSSPLISSHVRWSSRSANVKVLNEAQLLERARKKKELKAKKQLQILEKREPAIIVHHNTFTHPFKMQPVPDITASSLDEIPHVRTPTERKHDALEFAQQLQNQNIHPSVFQPFQTLNNILTTDAETTSSTSHTTSNTSSSDSSTNQHSTSTSSSDDSLTWRPQFVTNTSNEPTCFGIFELNGTQHKVVEGDLIMHDHLDVEVGSTLRFTNVLLLGTREHTIIGRPVIETAFIDAQVEEHTETRKMIVFHKKRKKNYRRTIGFRHHVTILRILSIHVPEVDGTHVINAVDVLRVHQAPTMLVKTSHPEDNVTESVGSKS